jgi:hypothetical protein
MNKGIVMLSLLALLLVPGASFSRTEPGSAITDVDKLQVLYLNTKFRDIRTSLSQLRGDLKSLSASMKADEFAQSYLIRRSNENIRSMEGVCRYMEGITNRLSHVKEDKLSYYCNLQKYGIEQMRNRSNEYLSNIKEIRAEISVVAASPLIDEVTEKILLSSVLINKVVKMLEQCSGEEEPASHH